MTIDDTQALIREIGPALTTRYIGALKQRGMHEATARKRVQRALEAMQFQKPVVAHRHSAHGFHSVYGRPIFEACDTIQDMADACLRLMDDEAGRQALIAAGQDYVLANHSRQMFSQRVREDCEDVLAKKGRVASPD